MDSDNCLDFIAIGAMKSGTTSVHKYLSEHENIFLPPEKEAPFFSDDERYAKGFDAYWGDFFGHIKEGQISGTVTPLYMMNPIVPGRIRETCPDVKLIAVLRDPIERAYSHYHMSVRIKGESRTFNSVVAGQLREENLLNARKRTEYWSDYVVYGEYGRILKDYYSVFPKEQILVLFMNELIDDPNKFMDKIFEFLGVETKKLKNVGKKFHNSKQMGVMPLVAHLFLNTRLRSVGKRMLPEKMRRRVRFWLGLYRSHRIKNVNTEFILSPEVRDELEGVYRKDARMLNELTGQAPYWLKVWQENV